MADVVSDVDGRYDLSFISLIVKKEEVFLGSEKRVRDDQDIFMHKFFELRAEVASMQGKRMSDFLLRRQSF